MKNVGEYIRAWLDEIGADGLMYEKYNVVLSLEDVSRNILFMHDGVPAFRHADGSYHTEKENK